MMDIKEGQTFTSLFEHQHQATIYVHITYSGHTLISNGDRKNSCSSICYILDYRNFDIYIFNKIFRSCIRANTDNNFSKYWNPRPCYLSILHRKKNESVCIFYEDI